MSAQNDLSSLRRRVLRAGSWAVGGHFTSQVVRLVGNLILTRMLMPEMFGVVGLATVFIVGLNMFSDLGLRQVIVHTKHVDDPTFLNTAWTIQIIRGCVVALAGLLLAGVIFVAASNGWVPADSTYAKWELPWVLGVLSLTMVISGFSSTKTLTTNRSLNIGRTTSIDLISQLVGLACMLLLAWWWPSVFVLAVGAIVGAVVSTVLSHVWLSGVGNRLAWNAAMAKEIVGFGKWIFLTSILGFLTVNEDRFVLGWLLSAENMGLYSIAALLSSALRDLVNKVVGMVVFPALGEISREHAGRIKELYYKVRFPIDVICLGAMGFLFMAGGTIVDVLYDNRYSGAGRMLEILSLTLFTVRYSIFGTLSTVLGKPKLMSHLQGVRLLALTVLMPAGYFLFGVPGAIWGVSLASMAELLPVLLLQKQFGVFDAKKELRVLVWLVLGLAAGALVHALKRSM